MGLVNDVLEALRLKKKKEDTKVMFDNLGVPKDLTKFSEVEPPKVEEPKIEIPKVETPKEPIKSIPSKALSALGIFIDSALGKMDYRSKQAQVGTMSDVGRMYNVVVLFVRYLTTGNKGFISESKRLLPLILDRLQPTNVGNASFWSLPARGGGNYDYKANIFNDKEACLAWCTIIILAYGCFLDFKKTGNKKSQQLYKEAMAKFEQNGKFWKRSRNSNLPLPRDGTYHAELAATVVFALMAKMVTNKALANQYQKFAEQRITELVEYMGRYTNKFGKAIIWPVFNPHSRPDTLRKAAKGESLGAMQSIYAVLAAAYMKILGKLGYGPFYNRKFMKQVANGVMYGAFYDMPHKVKLPEKEPFVAYIDNCVHPSSWFDRTNKSTRPEPVKVTSCLNGNVFHIGVNNQWDRYDDSLIEVENSIGGLLLEDAPEELYNYFLKNFAGNPKKPRVKFDANQGLASQVGMELRQFDKEAKQKR